MKAPKIRFKGFEGDWQKFKIKDICINKWTWTLTKDKVASEYWYPVINWWVSNYWYYFDYNNENAITISSRWENAGYAKYNKWKFRAWWLCYVYESQKHNTQFIGILLNGKEKHIKSTMIARTTIPALNKSEFNEYFITIPEKQKEQEKIWAFFEKLDTQITQQSQKLEKLKNIKQSFLQKLFPKDWSALPELRFKGFEGAWEEKKLGEISNRITRKNENLETLLPLTISAQFGLVDQITFFNNRIASSNIKWYYLIKKWEFAYNKSYSAWYPRWVIKQLKDYNMWALSTLYIIFSINSLKTNHKYILYFYETNLWHKDIAERAAEWARNHWLLNIAVNNFFDTNISLPSLPEQEKIWAFFEKLDTQITQQSQKIQKLQNLKQSLLEKMFI